MTTMLPSPKDPAFRDFLMTEIRAQGGCATAEDLRPTAVKAFNVTTAPEEMKNWETRISWALIILRDRLHYLESPPNSAESRQWILDNRPGRNPSQQVWRLTESGLEYLTSSGLKEPSLPISATEHDAKFKFDPNDIVDARERMAATIVARRGQAQFRDVLLSLYQGKCAITGTVAQEVLEAAHIIPYLGKQTNHPTNVSFRQACVNPHNQT